MTIPVNPKQRRRSFDHGHAAQLQPRVWGSPPFGHRRPTPTSPCGTGSRIGERGNAIPQQGSGCIIHLNIATCKWCFFVEKATCFKWLQHGYPFFSGALLTWASWIELVLWGSEPLLLKATGSRRDRPPFQSPRPTPRRRFETGKAKRSQESDEPKTRGLQAIGGVFCVFFA